MSHCRLEVLVKIMSGKPKDPGFDPQPGQILDLKKGLKWLKQFEIITKHFNIFKRKILMILFTL